jgi:hypothetical protein
LTLRLDRVSLNPVERTHPPGKTKEGHMSKKRLFRAPLFAALGVLVALVVPAAAQAHHIDLVASCDSSSTVSWKVSFVGFSSSAKPTTKGTVKVDGSVAQQVPSATIDFRTSPGTLSGSRQAAAGQTHVVRAEFTWSGGGQTKQVTTNACPPAPKPALTIAKDGPATRYVGDQATFSYKVTNTGNVSSLSIPVVTDDRCGPVTKVAEPNTSTFDPGDTFTYTCTLTITDAMGDQVVNVATACAGYSGAQRVCSPPDDHKTIIPKPAISLEKSGAATAVAGATYSYSFAATNVGNVHALLDDVELTDDRCQSTLVRVDDADTSFDPGDVWNYTCTAVAPAGPATVDNAASVCGTYNGTGVQPVTVCDEDTHTFTVPPPATTTPPVTTPPAAGAVLPETIASGLAQLRGPSGCVRQAFRARVSGRSIAAVAFHVDGKLFKRLSGERAQYSVKVKPGRYGPGRHKLVARVTFVSGSGTQARKLPLTFRRCARGAVAPRFTG